MSQYHKITFLAVFFLNTFCFGQYTDVINSNRPGESMSAFSVGKTIFQLEFGINGFKEKHNTLNYTANGFNSDIVARYGLIASEIEAIFNIQYQNDEYLFANKLVNRTGIKKTTLGFKYLVFDPYKKEKKVNIYSYKANNSFNWNDLIPAVALYAGINLNFSDNKFLTVQEPLLDPKVMIVTQNQFNNSQVLVMNVYLDKISSANSTLGYVVTYTKGFNEHWSAFIENKSFKSKSYSDAIFTGGAAYLFKKNTQIDISISKSVKNTPSLFYGGIGVSWRFDKNYKEDKIQVLKKKIEKKKKNNKVAVPNNTPTIQANPNGETLPEKIEIEKVQPQSNQPEKIEIEKKDIIEPIKIIETEIPKKP